MPRKQSYVTVTDQFCGAGGSSLGAVAAGAELRLALNQWKLAIETHNSNFPDAAHDCTDVSACDPRRYPSTDVLITSPECTNHSLAKGKGRRHYKTDLFGNVLIDPSEERSRATMWDVPRFAEYHRYALIIVENVVDARDWIMYDAWLHAMDLLGYAHQAVFFNSMFAWPTPQSRDRMYVVFWRKGNRAPDLDIRPVARCTRCGKDVDAVQNWKNAQRRYGRYGARGQYVYCCPDCYAIVQPYYYPALTAIDWSLPIERIGDRKKPLKEKTLQRIRLGLERFKDQHLVMDILYSHAHNNRAHPVTEPWPTQTAQQSLALLRMPLVGSNQAHNYPKPMTEPIATVLTGNHQYLVEPQIVEMHNHQSTRPVGDPMSTVVASTIHHGLLMPFLTRHYSTRGDDGAHLSRAVDEPLGAVTAADHHSLAVPFLTSYYGTDTGHALDEAMPTVPTKDRHALVAPMPFVQSYYGEGTTAAVDQAMGTQIGTEHQGIVQPVPFIVSQYGGESRHPVHAVTEPMMTVPGMQIHRLTIPSQLPKVEECGFRMLEPHEIGRAMAFPDEYIVLGNKRERVKQLGNAVTPPVMSLLIERCLETLR